MKMHVDWQGKRKFSAKGEASGHTIVMDASPDFGGENQGARPMELLLAGLGGCTGIDIVSTLEKMRLHVESLTIEIDGERAEEYPQRYTDIHLRYIINGHDLTPDKVERAIRLSKEKYCSASASLNANITTSFVLNGAEHTMS
ncbi:peroxiredoxin [Collibacillus ludicampi]|jgi:putative redox protein|uniref:Peroxiredoxin n=1 Tax=Collibacillus ludicampi TaxID=2771369 RepID=A0AAV4LK80_9BACL|nr:OsmC family protein [Collibacillus ludicampi]GIM48186.1 peroxiredoxin [Collibacillus ludicampi]